MSMPRWTGLILSLAIVVLASSSTANTQNVLTGTWTATIHNKNPDKIDLRFKYRHQRNGRSSSEEPYEFRELKGLTREQAQGSGPAKFSLVRESGRIDCFSQKDKGSGTFRFTADLGFVSAMKSRGFDFALRTDDEADGAFWLFFAATLNLGMEDLVKARNFNVNAELISQAKQMGFESESLEELVKMRLFKLTPEFIAEAHREGLTNLSLEDAVQLRIFNIDSAFIRQARADGVPAEVGRLVERRLGVGKEH
jgi:hypothetical protein